MDLSHSGAGHAVGADTTRATLRDCTFASGGSVTISTNNAFALVSLWAAIICTIDNCTFGRALQAIRGIEVLANSIAYSNAHVIKNCSFAYHAYSLVNPGQSWLVDGCTFEGTGGGLRHVIFIQGPWTTANQVQFYNVSPTDGYITRTAGSWLLDGWETGFTVTVSNTVSNNFDPLGTVSAVTDLTLTLTTSANVVTNETSDTATLSDYSTNFVPYAFTQANQLTFNQVLPADGYIVRTSGSWTSDGFQVGNTLQMDKTLHNSSAGPVFTVSTISPDGYTLTFSNAGLQNETSNTAILSVPIGANNLTFSNNWLGDYFSGTPWFMINGGINNLVMTGNFIASSGNARALVINGGLNAAFISGNYFDTTYAPVYLLRGYQNISGITITGNEYPYGASIVQTDPSVLESSLNPPFSQNYNQVPGLFTAGNYTNNTYHNGNIINIDNGYYVMTGTSLEVDGYGSSFICQSQNGNRWQILVNNSGGLYTIAAPAYPTTGIQGPQ